MDVRSNDEVIRKVKARWFAWQDQAGIARDLGMREAQVQSLARALELPPHGGKAVTDYIEGRPYDKSLEESWVARRRRQGN